MSAAEAWEAIPQFRKPAPVKAPVKLALGLQRSTTRLTLCVDAATLDRLGWTKGDELALEWGRAGKVAEWLRFSLMAGGSPLRALGRSSSMIASFAPPADVAGQEGASEAAEFIVLDNTGQLLVRLPWVLEGKA